MAQLGADVEQLDQLARKFSHESEMIRGAVQKISGEVGSVWWQGRDADNFRARWDSEMRGALNSVADSLAQTAQVVTQQATAQRQVSGG